jgi:hypothetical protein
MCISSCMVSMRVTSFSSIVCLPAATATVAAVIAVGRSTASVQADEGCIWLRERARGGGYMAMSC